MFRTCVGPLKLGDHYYSGPDMMAQILSDQYKSVFSLPKEDYSKFKYTVHQVTPLTDIELHHDMFYNAMKNIKPTSAPGPDGVPAFLYHHFAEELSKPVDLENLLRFGEPP